VVVVVVVVAHRPGPARATPVPGAFRRLRAGSLWLPVLTYEDGYGLAYGARFGLAGPTRRTTVSAPLTWGGERRASVTVAHAFEAGPLSRLAVDGGIWRREHPAFDVGETRREVGARVERTAGPVLRAGGGVRVAEVSWGDDDGRVTTAAADLTLDTRQDPTFPRNAVFALARIERLDLGADARLRRTADLRGFLGMPRGLVLASRGFIVSADGPLPPWERAWVGGVRTLRGHRPGARQDDNAAGGSIELRVPLTSPLSVGRVGVTAFADAAATYAAGSAVGRAQFDSGVGGGVFFSATLFTGGVDVARASGGGWRVHVTAGIGRR
jgi:hemolysin activation/secretion protein